MYSKEIKNRLKKEKVKVGNRISIDFDGKKYEGLLMPKTEVGDCNSVVVKRDDGYNIGIKYSKKMMIKKLGMKKPKVKQKTGKIKHEPKKPVISILHTGGTFASKVSYATGGVVAKFEPEELVGMFPELWDVANIKTRLIRNMFSEDMVFEHYVLMAKEIEKEIKTGVDGIIITHGTDTLGYTGAALSFMLKDLPVPVILVGAQKSSDRGSTDAAMNIICAANFITNTDFSEVGVCMHGSMDDSTVFVNPATKTRKMHASRRDAFRPVNAIPWALVDYNTGKIKFLRKDYTKKDKKRELKVKSKMEKKVALLKIHPSFDYRIIDFLTKQKYKGLVLEGTGLGHAQINEIDEFTKSNKKLFQSLSKFIKSGGVIVMVSQTLYGRVNMNVYETGHRLQQIGVVPGEDMLPETAYVKLAWLLANYPKEKAKDLIRKNIAGEISERTTGNRFLY